MKERSCSHIGFWLFIISLAALLLVSFSVNLGLLLAWGMQGSLGQVHGEPEDQYPKFTEKWSYGYGTSKVVRISYFGVISREIEGGLWGVSMDPVESTLRQIRAARQDDAVAGILFEVDSPGGEMTASDELYRELMLFKQSREDRRILVFVRDMAASGGYYMALAGDCIVAQPTALLGSIGVIMQTLNWKGLSDKIGITDTTIKSGANKDLLNPFKEVPPEQLAIMQDTVDYLYDFFFDIVRRSRNIEAAALKPLADGRVFSAQVALTNNFIDQVGYWEDALVRMAQLLGEEDIHLVYYESRQTFWEVLAQARLPDPARWVRASSPRFLYLWKP